MSSVLWCRGERESGEETSTLVVFVAPRFVFVSIGLWRTKSVAPLFRTLELSRIGGAGYCRAAGHCGRADSQIGFGGRGRLGTRRMAVSLGRRG